MKGIFKNYIICPKERLNYFYNQISEFKETRRKLSLNKDKNLSHPQQLLNFYENNKTFNKTLVKISPIYNKKKNITFNHKNIKSFPKELNIFKNKANKTIYNNNNDFRAYNSEKELYIKDTKILKHYKKYKDIYKRNEDNIDIVKKAFINDYKKNIEALNNYLTINDKIKQNDLLEENYKNKNTIINNYQNKIIDSFKTKRTINKHIQINPIDKEYKFFINKSIDKKKLNNLNINFKEAFKTNYITEKENKIIKKLHNINTIKTKKLKEYNYLSTGGKLKGNLKINQDCLLIMNDILGCKEAKIFGVLDGHGKNGDSLAQEISDLFKEFFSNINYYDYYNEINGINLYKFFSDNNYEKIFEIFSLIDDKIHQKYESNDYCIRCGATVNILILFSKKKLINKIISINLGNTKSIEINEHNQIKQLNICHVPTVEEEKIRIEKNGGEVGRAEWLNDGPLRIWKKGKKYSGLSITRSFGDFESEKLGVNSIPDIKEYDIDEEKSKIIILATEGLWTFLKNEKIMDIVLPYYKISDIKGAIKKLTEIATNLWEIKNPYEISDITIIILFFK